MQFRRAHDPEADDATDAIVDGDRALRRGTAQAALRHRDFRLVWGGTFASNCGTWMQNVFLGQFASRAHRRPGLRRAAAASPNWVRCCSSARSAASSPTW